MKNQAGINLSNLSEAQKKMLVRLIALNNVQISHDKDSYFATLKVPTDDVNNYLQKQIHKNKQNPPSKSPIKSPIKVQPLQQHTQNKQKVASSSSLLVLKPTSSASPIATCSQKTVPASKKPLFKSVKLQPIPRLEQLSPLIEIYIYPKRLPLITIQQQIQQTYEQYWQVSQNQNAHGGGGGNFVGSFYETVCVHFGLGNKAKNDQSLVNTLESFNHYQNKQIGVKMFVKFLAQEYSKQQLSYFIVLRSLLEQIYGQKICQKPKQTSSCSSSQTNLTPTFPPSKSRATLKWNPFIREIPESIAYKFLEVIDQKTVSVIFEKLTSQMYYCEDKKGNYISYYGLMQFMVQEFEKQCHKGNRGKQQGISWGQGDGGEPSGVDVDGLNLSFSNNDDSTLKDILLEYSCRTDGSRLKTKFQMQLISEQQPQPQQPTNHNLSLENDNLLVESALQKAREMCKRTQISSEKEQKILQKVIYCVDSIRTMDKMKWVQAMQIEGKQQQLYFIQELQMFYRNCCHNGNSKITIVNNLIKKIFGGPGFIKMFREGLEF